MLCSDTGLNVFFFVFVFLPGAEGESVSDGKHGVAYRPTDKRREML